MSQVFGFSGKLIDNSLLLFNSWLFRLWVCFKFQFLPLNLVTCGSVDY
jgi:hypothetical protein